MPKKIKKVLFHQISMFLGLAIIVAFSSIFGAILLRQVLAAPPTNDKGVIMDRIGTPILINTLFAGQQKIYEKIMGLPESEPPAMVGQGDIVKKVGLFRTGGPGDTLFAGQNEIYNAVRAPLKIWAYNSISGQWEDFGELDYCKLNPYGDKANVMAWTCYNRAGYKYTYAGGVAKDDTLLNTYDINYPEPTVGGKWVTSDVSSKNNFCIYCRGAAYALADHGNVYQLGPTAGTIPIPGVDNCVEGVILGGARPEYIRCVFGGYSAMRIQATQPVAP